MNNLPRDIVAECLLWPPLTLRDLPNESVSLIYDEADRIIARLDERGYQIVRRADV